MWANGQRGQGHRGDFPTWWHGTIETPGPGDRCQLQTRKLPMRRGNHSLRGLILQVTVLVWTVQVTAPTPRPCFRGWSEGYPERERQVGTPGAQTGRGHLWAEIPGLQGGAEGQGARGVQETCCQVGSNHGQWGEVRPPSQDLQSLPWEVGIGHWQEPPRSLAWGGGPGETEDHLSLTLGVAGGPQPQDGAPNFPSSEDGHQPS